MALTAPTSSMRAQASCRCLRPVATRSSSTMIMPVTQPNQARIRHVILSGLRLLTGTGGGGKAFVQFKMHRVELWHSTSSRKMLLLRQPASCRVAPQSAE